MRVPRSHPSRRKLTRWLEHGDPTLDQHLGTCERCARHLEAAAKPDEPISQLLGTLLSPPEDLQKRLRAGISRKLQTREDMALLGEMFGLPMQTLRTLGQPEDYE